MKKAGNLWLRAFYNLNQFSFTQNSYIDSNDTIELTANEDVNQVYGTKYAPDKDTPFEHLVFSLKYDALVDEQRYITAALIKIPDGKSWTTCLTQNNSVR